MATWSGVELPEGLSEDQAKEAATLIYNWADDWPGSEVEPGGDLSLEELIVRLYRVLSAPLGQQSR